MTPPTYQFARFPGWIPSYTAEMKKNTERSIKISPNTRDFYEKKLGWVVQIQEMLDQLVEKHAIIDKEQQVMMEATANTYTGIDATFMAFKNKEIIEHFPPQYILG